MKKGSPAKCNFGNEQRLAKSDESFGVGNWNLQSKEHFAGLPKGFTLVELIIVVAITMIIILVALSTQGSFLVNTNLENNTTQIVETLRLAGTRAESGFHDDSWGVFLNENTFVLFKGADYVSRDASFDIETTLPSSISISDINLNGGGGSVVFNKLTGETSQYGYLILSDNSSNTKEITINSKGTVSY